MTKEQQHGGETILEVSHLKVGFGTEAGEVQAVRDVSFSLKEGEVLAIVGESGCGKSVLCKSIMKMLPSNARIKEGNIFANGVDITGYKEREMAKLRGKFFSMVFQDPMTTLNPTMTIGEQIAEAIRLKNPRITKKELETQVEELLDLVGITNPKEQKKMYPYHFSGGMRQRSVLAIALAGNPSVLIADEPTTALDVTIQAQILDLFREIQKKRNTATIFVTHDLGVVARVADRVAVMYAGKIVEIGTVEDIFYDARHPYTWGLMQALPAFAKKHGHLQMIPGMPPSLIHPPQGDAFAARNPYALAIDYKKEPPMFRISETHAAATWLLDERAPKVLSPFAVQGMEAEGEKEKERNCHPAAEVQQEKKTEKGELLVDVRHLTKRFPMKNGKSFTAVKDVSFQIYKGEIFGIVGESGSGKSTVAKCLMNIHKPEEGEIFFRGINTTDKKEFRENRKILQRDRQVIFQDSTSSLDQRKKVKDIIAEPFRIQHVTPQRGTYEKEAAFQLKYVGMEESYTEKYPSEMSGGQRQRVAIARAVAMEPELLVADEPIASLDVSIQAQIVNLFAHLREEHGFSILFIAHDLAMVRFLCDRVGVMYHGRLVEVGSTEQIFENPKHPYTRSLLSAIPVPDPKKERQRIREDFQEEALEQDGIMIEQEPGHFVYMNREEAAGK